MRGVFAQTCKPAGAAARHRSPLQESPVLFSTPKTTPPNGSLSRAAGAGPPLAGRTCSRHAGGGGQHRRNAFVARRRALLPGRIRAERACGATGKTTFEDSYDRGGGAVPTMWAGGVACPSGPSRPVSGGRAATFHAARQPKRSIDLAHWIPRCPACCSMHNVGLCAGRLYAATSR